MKPDRDTTQWNLLVHIAQQRLDDCTRRMGKLAGRREEAAAKLQTLLDYRSNYLAQLDGAQRNGIGADGLRNFQSFVASLDHAIEQQTGLLTALQKLIFDCEAAMRELQRKIHSYRVLQDRRAAEARTRDRRRQQTLQDEMASRMRVPG